MTRISLSRAERRAYNYPGGAFALDRALGLAFAIENKERPLGFGIPRRVSSHRRAARFRGYIALISR
jgi:hypothetical protein